VAHRTQVVNLVGLHLLHDADQVGAIGQVAVVQSEALVVDMRVLVQVVDTVGVERLTTTFYAVHMVALGQQQFCKVRAVLAGNAGDECGFGHELCSFVS